AGVGAIGRDAEQWVRRFLDDLAVVRSANTVRAYGADIARWVAFCAAHGVHAIAGKPALLRYDAALPQTLSGAEMDRFVENLTATRHRDRAIVWLLKDGGVRIGELLELRVADVDWSKRTLTVRASKTRSTRLVPITTEAIAVLAEYVRLERPKPLPHDYVFVNLGRRGFGQPFRYRSWVAVCEKARRAAATPRVHAHAFRHTFATNMTEGGMALD